MFDVDKLIFIIAVTIIIFLFSFKFKTIQGAFYFGLFIVLYLLYNGIGGALLDAPNEYLGFYFIFTIAISVGCLIGVKQYHPVNEQKVIEWKEYFNLINEKYYKQIIVTYFVLLFIGLVYPENKLMNLLNPPTPDVIGQLLERYDGVEKTTALTSIIQLLKLFVYPFFLITLYKFRKKVVILAVLVVLPAYITYAQDEYIGRGSMLECIIMFAFIVYLENKRLRMLIIASIIIFVPTLVVFFVDYSVVRVGGDELIGNFGDAYDMLLWQECHYPERFDELLAIRNHPTTNYIIWLFTLPFPGFFRGGIDANFNAIFSEEMIGINRGDRGFFIMLPGLVGESVFVFGEKLYWLNGLLTGLLMGYLFKFFKKYPQAIGLFTVIAIDFAYTFCRGGMTSGLTFIGKSIVWFFIISIIFMKNRTGSRANLITNH